MLCVPRCEQKRSNVPVTQATAELLSSSACVGADCLMKLLGNYCRNLDIKTAITVGVVGKHPVQSCNHIIALYQWFSTAGLRSKNRLQVDFEWAAGMQVHIVKNEEDKNNAFEVQLSGLVLLF